MQQLGSGHVYHSDHMASSHHAAHASRERLDPLRMGQDYHVHHVERSQFDGRVLADSRGRPIIAPELSSRGREYSQSQSQGLSTRSPARSASENLNYVLNVMVVDHSCALQFLCRRRAQCEYHGGRSPVARGGAPACFALIHSFGI